MRRKITAVLLVFMFMVSFTVVGIGATDNGHNANEIETVGGNPKPDELIEGDFPSGEIKCNSETVTYAVHGKYLEWKSDTDSSQVKQVYVKGGPAVNIYHYSGATGGTNIQAPKNHGGNIPDISWFGFVCAEIVPPDTGGLIVEKKVISDDYDGKEFKVKITDSDGDYYEYSIKPGSDIELDNIATGTYSIEETEDQGAVTVEYTGNVEENDNGFEFTITSGEATAITITNTYDDDSALIEIKKVVQDADGKELPESEQPDVDFIVNISNDANDAEDNPDDYYNEDHVVNPSEGTKMVTGLPLGYNYTVEEVEHPDYDFVSIDPGNFHLTTTNNEVFVTVVNKEKDADNGNGDDNGDDNGDENGDDDNDNGDDTTTTRRRRTPPPTTTTTTPEEPKEVVVTPEEPAITPEEPDEPDTEEPRREDPVVPDVPDEPEIVEITPEEPFVPPTAPDEPEEITVTPEEPAVPPTLPELPRTGGMTTLMSGLGALIAGAGALLLSRRNRK